MPDQSFSKVSFYIVAHADDWQLFMQPNVYNDLIAPNTKVIFIITTAGDAGFDRKFWSAREEGCKSSIRFCLAPISNLIETSGDLNFNDRTIHYWSANNVTCYFLRLPDGNLDGNGFSTHQNESLSKFKKGQISTIKAIDGSAIYNSWSEFCRTLEAIIISERKNIEAVVINYLTPDTVANPNDHNDHIITGEAIQTIDSISAFHQILFVGYSVNTIDNITPTELFWKTGMFAAYEKTVFDIYSYSTLHESVGTYLKWCLSGPKFITNNPQDFIKN